MKKTKRSKRKRPARCRIFWKRSKCAVRRRRNPGGFESIRPGDRVTMRTGHGQQVSGRVVMRSSHGGWVLNLGGRHGTPGLVDRRNFVSVRKGKRATWLNPNTAFHDTRKGGKYSALGRRFDKYDDAVFWAKQKILNDGKKAEAIDVMEKVEGLPWHRIMTIDPWNVKSAYNPRRKR